MEVAMEQDLGNLQNDFFNAMRKDRTPVTILLENGTKLVGRIRSFDKFTLLLDTDQGEQIVFKHAISTVSAAQRASHERHEHARAGGHGS
jgi:host factor-I protein